MKKNIVIADNDESFLKELSEMLAINNYNSKNFIRINDAFRYALKHQIDIVIFDIGINAKEYHSNFEIIQSLLEKGIKLIALITYCDETNFLMLKINSGIKTFLIKPVFPLDIIAILNKIAITNGANNENNSK